jgi:hypothetical protein
LLGDWAIATVGGWRRGGGRWEGAFPAFTLSLSLSGFGITWLGLSGFGITWPGLSGTHLTWASLSRPGFLLGVPLRYQVSCRLQVSGVISVLDAVAHKEREETLPDQPLQFFILTAYKCQDFELYTSVLCAVYDRELTNSPLLSWMKIFKLPLRSASLTSRSMRETAVEASDTVTWAVVVIMYEFEGGCSAIKVFIELEMAAKDEVQKEQILTSIKNSRSCDPSAQTDNQSPL